jgi:O-antigen/teichoic acid export membrane protein
MSRTRRALSGGIVLVVHGLVGAVTPFILSPLLLRFNGKEAVGGFSIVLQIVAYVVLLDLGVGQALSRELAQAGSLPERKPDSDRAVVTAALLLCGFGLLASAVLYAISQSLPLWLNDPPAAIADLRGALVAYACWMPFRFALTLGPTLIYARQSIAAYATIAVGVDVVRAAAMVAAVAAGRGLFGIAVANICAEGLGLVTGMALAARQLRSIDWRSRPNRASVRRLARIGVPSALITLGDRLTFYSQSIIVGAIFDARAAASFYATRASGNAGMALIWRGLDSTVPGLNDLYSRGDRTAFYSAYMRLAGYAVGIALWFGAVLFAVNEGIVSAWLGTGFYVGNGMTAALCVLAPLATFKNVATKVLVVEGEVQQYIWVLVAEGAANLALSILAGHLLGTGGVMLAVVLAHMVSVPYLLRRAAAAAGLSAATMVGTVMRIGVRCSAAGAVTALLAGVASGGGLRSVLLVVGASAIAGSAGFVAFGLSDTDRSAVLSLATRHAARERITRS